MAGSDTGGLLPNESETCPPPPTASEAAHTADLIARRQLWPLAEAAYQLGISIPTLNRRARAGDIRKLRVGGRAYISDAELRRHVANLEAAAG